MACSSQGSHIGQLNYCHGTDSPELDTDSWTCNERAHKQCSEVAGA